MVNLRVLKKGFDRLTESTKARRDAILARVKRGEKVSDADERFIDQEANLVDEQAVLDTLEESSDFERDIGKLSEKDKSVVNRLKAAAGSVGKAFKKVASSAVKKTVAAAKVTGAVKRKRTSPLFSSSTVVS